MGISFHGPEPNLQGRELLRCHPPVLASLSDTSLNTGPARPVTLRHPTHFTVCVHTYYLCTQLVHSELPSKDRPGAITLSLHIKFGCFSSHAQHKREAVRDQEVKKKKKKLKQRKGEKTLCLEKEISGKEGDFKPRLESPQHGHTASHLQNITCIIIGELLGKTRLSPRPSIAFTASVVRYLLKADISGWPGLVGVGALHVRR